MTKISPTAGRLLLWATNTLLVLVFLVMGAAKFILPEAWEAHFVLQWGLPARLVSWVGWLEVAGAVLLLPRRTAVAGGTLLALIMAGATATHTLAQEWPQALLSGALMGLAAWVAARRQAMAAVEGRPIEAEGAGAAPAEAAGEADGEGEGDPT